MEPSHYHGVPAKYSNIRLRPFALAKGEEIRRLDIVARLTFDDLCQWTRPFETALFQSPLLPAGRLARSIVPAELARPGDQQVVVHSRDGEPHAPPLCIDFLADLPSVVSVVADRQVEARRQLPQVRELLEVGYFSQPVDRETLANMPGLVSLSLGTGWGSEKCDLEVLRAAPGLRDLHFQALAVRSIEPLAFLKGIERLRIDGIASERASHPLAGLTRLRFVHLECWKGLHILAGLENLELVSLMDASLANLKAFKAWRKVRSLALSGRGVRSLEGIDALESLEQLFLGGPAIRDLKPLRQAKNLRLLKLIHCDRVEDFAPLGQMKNLRSVVIYLGSPSTTGHVSTISFLAGLEQLEEFELRGAVIDDGRLDVLLDLPKLRRVMLLGDFGHQLERLCRHKPECTVEIVPLPGESAIETIQAGSVTIRKYDEGSWSIFQDLTGLLNVDNNFVASERIRHAIKQQDASLLDQLEFDPDADFVSITAQTEADIRKVAQVIRTVTLRV
jgi:hypothetical protein